MAQNQNIEKFANAYLDSDKAKKLTANKGGLDKLLNSRDGQKIKSLVENDAKSLNTAVKNGDMETLQNAMKSILKTEEGARLAKQLSDMMKET